MPTTNTKHYQTFKKAVENWFRFFGLLDWELYVKHSEDSDDCIAWTVLNFSARLAEINLNKNWTDSLPLNDRELKKAAFHEITEILLGRLRWLALKKDVPEEDINEECHAIISRLENSVFK